MSAEEKKPWETAEWRVRTAMSVLGLDKDEAENLERAKLLRRPDLKFDDVLLSFSSGNIGPKLVEKLARGLLGIPEPLPAFVPPEYVVDAEPPGVPGPVPAGLPQALIGAVPDSGLGFLPEHWLEKARKSPPIRIAPSTGSPVLRAFREPIFDTVIVPEDGVVRTDAFADPKWFPDHSPKVAGRDTNLLGQGQLCFPTEYDLHYLEVVFEKFAHVEDFRRVLRSTTVRWVFGQDTRWLDTRLSLFEPSFSYESLAGFGSDPDNVVERFRDTLNAYRAENFWPVWRHDMRDKKTGRPRRIFSTESFHCRVECDAGELYGPVRMRIAMQDTLYKQV